jgi:hypothetical protein
VYLPLLANHPPVPDAGGSYVVDEGGIVNLDGMQSTDPDLDDSLSYEWDLDYDGVRFDIDRTGVGTQFNASNLDGPSNRTIALRVTDDSGASDIDTTLVTINNVAPTVNTPVVTAEPSIKGSTVVARATFNDPGPNDAPFTCTVNYGDGSGALTGSVSGSTCTGPSHIYGNIGAYPVTISVRDKDNSIGSKTITHAVMYNFSGFFSPVANPPTINSVRAGAKISLIFSLGGNQGLNILFASSPASQQINCTSLSGMGTLTVTNPPGSSGLTYNAKTNRYTYAWTTDRAWKGTCRKFTLKLNDGREYFAYFSVTK